MENTCDDLVSKFFLAHSGSLFNRNSVISLPFEHVEVAGTVFFAVLSAVGREARFCSFDDGETFVHKALVDEVVKLRNAVARASCYKCSACAFCKLCNVEVRFDVSERRCRRFVTACRGRRILTAGHAVDTVVEADERDVDVSSASVDEVVSADSERVAVTRNYDVGPWSG